MQKFWLEAKAKGNRLPTALLFLYLTLPSIAPENLEFINFINMPEKENTIKINSEKIEIIENKKPIRVMFYLTLTLSILLGITSGKEYLKSGETGHLFISSLMLTLFVLGIIKEIFYVTYKKEIKLQNITKLGIKPILFSNGKALLEVKIGNKIRPIELNKKKAEMIKKELEILITQMSLQK